LWEPRIRIESVSVEADPSDAESAIATITYKLVATQTLERVSLNVKLTD
jgi:phage baseplate assembly protein W